jgi:DNA (cytosine-5)-methyltransferase 1
VSTRKGSRIDHQICSELEAEGYEVRTLLLPACAFGAPQHRDWRSRVFILAYPNAEFGQLRREQHEEDREEEGHLCWQGLEPPVARMVDGIPHRVDSITGLGNALLPQIAKFIGRRIVEYDQQLRQPADGRKNETEHDRVPADYWEEPQSGQLAAVGA